MISIIVPIYKVEEYLNRCIDSIVSQSGNYELILVDDGSPDKCPQICEEYAKIYKCIKLIHKENGGVSSARNTGLNCATGEWIWFIDGDDYINLNVISRIENYLKKYPKADFIQMGMDFHNMDEIVRNEIKEINSLTKKEFFVKYKSHHNHRVLFKREIIQKYNLSFTENIRIAEDQEFQLKYIMMCMKPVQIPISAYVYRERVGSATHGHTTYRNTVNDILIVLQNIASFIKEYNISPDKWISVRISDLVRGLLFASSKIDGLNKKELKSQLNKIAIIYQQLGFKCFYNIKFFIARKNITIYFVMNQYYNKIRDIINL